LRVKGGGGWIRFACAAMPLLLEHVLLLVVLCSTIVIAFVVILVQIVEVGGIPLRRLRFSLLG
jgi:hypothetical protein